EDVVVFELAQAAVVDEYAAALGVVDLVVAQVRVGRVVDGDAGVAGVHNVAALQHQPPLGDVHAVRPDGRVDLAQGQVGDSPEVGLEQNHAGAADLDDDVFGVAVAEYLQRLVDGQPLLLVQAGPHHDAPARLGRPQRLLDRGEVAAL